MLAYQNSSGEDLVLLSCPSCSDTCSALHLDWAMPCTAPISICAGRLMGFFPNDSEVESNLTKN